MKTLALATLFVAACAGRATPTTTTARGPASGFPALAGEARVMVADIDNRSIRNTREGRVETRVRLCVAPSGTVDAVDVVDSSGHDGYDRAVVQSAREWKFQTYEAAAADHRCTRMNVVHDAI